MLFSNVHKIAKLTDELYISRFNAPFYWYFIWFVTVVYFKINTAFENLAGTVYRNEEKGNIQFPQTVSIYE